MLTVEEALQRVLDHAHSLPPRNVPLAEALDCLLAEDVTADLDLPPFDKALVDGYAVRSDDLRSGQRRLKVVEEIVAGAMPTRTIGPGETAAIMTGAPLPDGADAVVMIERTERVGIDEIEIDPAGSDVSPGQFRLQRGRELHRGEIVLRPGERLNPPRIGLLAAVGRIEPLVIPTPEVVIVPTGDELVEPDQPPGPGQIRNSNAALLRALAQAAGARADVVPIAPDEPGPLRERLAHGLNADVLLVTGGVSAGLRDLVPGTLEELGVQAIFHKVRIKPGKPLLFARGPERSGGRPGSLVFGLPGNPVSGLVNFLLFVRPALGILKGFGAVAQSPRTIRARLGVPFSHRGDRPTYHPARLAHLQEPVLEPLPWAGSPDLRGVAAADGFAAFPAGDRDYKPDELVDFLPLF